MSNSPGEPEDDRFHSAHVPELKPDHRPLRWDRSRRGERPRVKAYTCDCQDTFYELCQAGGQLFIRRTRRIKGVVLVDECARGLNTRTASVWRMLLLGEAG